MGSSRQESWSGLPQRPLGDLPHPGIEPKSLGSTACLFCLQAGSLPQAPLRKPYMNINSHYSPANQRAGRRRWRRTMLLVSHMIHYSTPSPHPQHIHTYPIAKYFFKNNLFIHLFLKKFIFNCTGSSLLHRLFSSCQEQGVTLQSHFRGFSLPQLLLLSTGSVVVEHKWYCSETCGIFPG